MLTVAWTCYPVAFGSIVSTLAIPLLIAAIGIIFRGTAYALRSQFSRDEERGVRLVEYLFALSSVLTPFALATVIGAIATGRVPVGNARGDLVTSLAEPGLGAGRGARGGLLRVPGRGLPGRRRPPIGRTGPGSTISASGLSPPAWWPARWLSPGCW